MKTILSILLLGMVACSNKKTLALEESIKVKENQKGYSSIKRYDILTERQVDDLLIIRFSATVVSPITFQEVLDTDNIKLRKMESGSYIAVD
jgi:hypothetical protein